MKRPPAAIKCLLKVRERATRTEMPSDEDPRSGTTSEAADAGTGVDL